MKQVIMLNRNIISVWSISMAHFNQLKALFMSNIMLKLQLVIINTTIKFEMIG